MDPIEADTPMVVTDCPECDGTGFSDGAGEQVSCGNDSRLGGDAWFNEYGRHVVPIETLEGEENDEVDVPTESGPEAGGMVPVAETEAAQGVEAAPGDPGRSEGLDWPDDPIGVVVVGDDNGLAHVVTRALGGVEGPFTESMADEVDEFRADCGLDDYPEGVVVGKVWAMVLPLVTVGTTGQVARWLCKALELPVQNVVTTAIMAEAITKSNPTVFDTLSPDEDVAAWIAKYEFDVTDWLAVL